MKAGSSDENGSKAGNNSAPQLKQTALPSKDETRARNVTSSAGLPLKGSHGDQAKGIDHREVGRKLKQDYAHGSRDPSIRQLDAVHSLVELLMKTDTVFEDMLQQTARLIFSQFNVREVAIALKSQSDGLFRYVAEHGMRADVWKAHSSITYTDSDLTDTSRYKPTTISNYTHLYLAEDNPYGPDEGDTFAEHLMLKSKRKSFTDSIEGDYIDVFIRGPHGDTFGWIELSGTWDGRVPDARTIKCLEIVASVIGVAIVRRGV